ncbi:MAG: hypothetical protein J3R72DRAFT_450456 [Linnemannia gamsii]|nr:MAG: hypothetical protein J3R72DRAFT_450456 [Linnemannia gamsii]
MDSAEARFCSSCKRMLVCSSSSRRIVRSLCASATEGMTRSQMLQERVVRSAQTIWQGHSPSIKSDSSMSFAARCVNSSEPLTAVVEAEAARAAAPAGVVGSTGAGVARAAVAFCWGSLTVSIRLWIREYRLAMSLAVTSLLTGSGAGCIGASVILCLGMYVGGGCKEEDGKRRME